MRILADKKTFRKPLARAAPPATKGNMPNGDAKSEREETLVKVTVEN
jgi:hypothetical protein